jgi:hypothetical protein
MSHTLLLFQNAFQRIPDPQGVQDGLLQQLRHNSLTSEQVEGLVGLANFEMHLSCMHLIIGLPEQFSKSLCKNLGTSALSGVTFSLITHSFRS